MIKCKSHTIMKLICAERFLGVPIRRMTLHNCDAIEDGLTPDGKRRGDRSRQFAMKLGLVTMTTTLTWFTFCFWPLGTESVI